MANILWTFSRQLSGLDPKLLLAIALVTIAAGIFSLLGGLGFRKLLFIIIGLYCGAGFVVSGKCSNIFLAIASVGVGITLALTLQDAFLVLAASLFAAIYGFSTLIHPYVNTSGELVDIMRDLAIGVPFYNWPFLLILVVIPIAARATWWHGTAAALCSLAGTLLLLAGSIMLYVASGLKVAESIFSKREIYLGCVAAVVVVGTVVQILLLPRLSKRIADAKETARIRRIRFKKNKSDDQPAPKNTTWRTA
ncbi:MAG: hypothetical protein JW749_12125 [Sedimentisphaerales bacterium]|nr:hypothetical protein [Sedimentisphaerales bacterium]